MSLKEFLASEQETDKAHLLAVDERNVSDHTVAFVFGHDSDQVVLYDLHTDEYMVEFEHRTFVTEEKQVAEQWAYAIHKYHNGEGEVEDVVRYLSGR